MKTVLGIVVALLGAVTVLVLNDLHEDRVQEAEQRIHDATRAFFRDEDSRPASHYESYPFLRQTAYSRTLQELKRDEVRVPSPLLTFKAAFVRINFQVTRDGAYSSPQAPAGSEGEIAALGPVPEDRLAAERAILQRVKGFVPPDLEAGDFFDPRWIGDELVYVRRTGDKLQGFWVDWPALKKNLLGRIVDLFPEADLVPVRDDFRPIALRTRMWSAMRWTEIHTLLVLIWVLIIFLAGYGISKQRAALERERRFAGSVAHELRGPLTTFRLYHELLDEGLVAEEKIPEYYKTLRSDSVKLGHTVENVIAYTRQKKLDLEPVAVGRLIGEAMPAAADVAVDLGGCEDVTVQANLVAANQILENLVSNAEKYGKQPFELAVERRGGTVRIRFRDAGEGPGGDPFRPYDRGKHHGSASRGLGLGLTLARGMARMMGGDLRLERPATFVLSLPVAVS